MKELTSVELAYMAGYFDADGCVTGINSKREGPVLRLCITSTDLVVLETFQKALGGHIALLREAGVTSRGVTSRRIIRQWSAAYRTGTKVAKALLPYLRQKRHRMGLYLEMRGLKENKTPGAPVSEEVRRRRQEILDEIRALNQGKYSATRVAT